MAELRWQPAGERTDLLAAATAAALPAGAEVAEIDAELADTEAFCAEYGIRLDESANCVVVAGKRGGVTTYAACVVLATTRADVNTVVRKHLDVRKATFARLEVVAEATGMEYGGITPVGLPEGYRILVDKAVADHPSVVVGSGLRRSKLRLPGAVVAALPGVEVLPGLGVPLGG